jgi:hypothetical protein
VSVMRRLHGPEVVTKQVQGEVGLVDAVPIEYVNEMSSNRRFSRFCEAIETCELVW